MIPKNPRLKSKKITQSAKGENCTLRIPGVCNFNPETTVFCHAPCVDKGIGIKSPDWWGAFGCSSCHDAVDGRLRTGIDYVLYWMPAIYETLKILIQKNLIGVK